MFNKETYIKRRNKLKEQVSSGVILLLGNDESSMNYADNTYHFRQDSSFLYFFGLDIPGLAAIIDIENDFEAIYGTELSIDDIVWMGPQDTLQQQALNYSGIKNFHTKAELNKYISTIKEKKRRVHFLPPYRPENKIKLVELLDVKLDEIKDIISVNLIKAIIEQREIKSEEEIIEIEKAVGITNQMHLTAMKMAKPGITEAEIAAAVHQIPLAADCNIAFPIIATIRGEVLHNHHHKNILKEGQLFLLDAGAESKMHYAGDMSRTTPVSGTFTAQQKIIYDICLTAHEAALQKCGPGVKFKDVHFTAATSIAEGLKQIGLMKGDIKAAVEAGAHALFFQCGTGHMMGLDTHDMEDLGEQFVGYTAEEPKELLLFGLKSLRLGKVLKPGMVVTIEPGIYFIPELIKMWKEEKRFIEFINYDKVEEYIGFGGLRNEDDVLITEDGYRVFGGFVPKTTEDIERYKAGESLDSILASKKILN
ncbi:aminopeptidase P family protein [Solitalea lacus]|uniref:aminopeptidase P family protein n=1 Tax=Solitalea lacus TaxID=2911172 RepID=UPI001EDA7285|nr:aminopeptidase P family protein [Solitalea lacus]UKJ08888.1 aminopeptidase P family protein [Solitalea lacus]